MAKEITETQIRKNLRNINGILGRLRHERERVRIGFLDAENPRLMQLLNDVIECFEYYKAEWKIGLKNLRILKRLELEVKTRGEKI